MGQYGTGSLLLGVAAWKENDLGLTLSAIRAGNPPIAGPGTRDGDGAGEQVPRQRRGARRGPAPSSTALQAATTSDVDSQMPLSGVM